MFIDGDWETREVHVDGKLLRPGKSQKAWNHSPDGFNWGYGGSGPAQLALALLMLVTDQKTAISYHQAFKWNFVAKLPQTDFEIEIDVDKWIEDQFKFEIDRYPIKDPI